MSGFKDVIGHKDIIQYIGNAVNSGKVSHAYILNGDKGSGKKLLANLFAASLLCKAPDADGGACGKCVSCSRAEHGNHPDIIHVSHEKPASVGIDDIRSQVKSDVYIRPYCSRYKIYIIPDADKMTEAAQNALLKTLEEPPSYVIIFLLTQNADALLPTIRSRCVMLKLHNIKDALVKKYLMEYMEIPEDRADICTAFAQGNIGKAVMLAGSGNFNEIKEEVVHLMREINDIGTDGLVQAVRRSMEYKIDVSDYFDVIAVWFRDVLIYKATKDADRVVFKDQLRHIRARASKSSYEGIEVILEALEKAKKRVKANVSFELAMELLLLTIKEN